MAFCVFALGRRKSLLTRFSCNNVSKCLWERDAAEACLVTNSAVKVNVFNALMQSHSDSVRSICTFNASERVIRILI